jgi:hypothetical protein
MQLDVHLYKGFLHMQNMCGRITKQVVPMTPVTA